MLIALTIVLLGGGGNDIWLFPEDFTDQVEEVVLEEKRQSEILDLFDKINESVNSQNDGIKDLAEKMSLFNRNPDTTEKEIEEILTAKGYDYDESSYELGEVSFHYGWTYHRTGPNKTNKTRKVMTIIYMDGHMCLAEPKNPNQQIDWDKWCPGAKVGEQIQTPLNPVVWSENESEEVLVC